MVPILFGNGGRDVGVHKAIRQISGHGHHAPKVGNKHTEGAHPESSATGFSFFLGLLHICLDKVDEPGDGLWLIKLATSAAHHESNVDMLNGVSWTYVMKTRRMAVVLLASFMTAFTGWKAQSCTKL